MKIHRRIRPLFPSVPSIEQQVAWDALDLEGPVRVVTGVDTGRSCGNGGCIGVIGILNLKILHGAGSLGIDVPLCTGRTAA